MASPDMLVMRIRTAAAEIEAARAAGDLRAGWRASQKYESALKQLEEFEAEQAERNERVIATLEKKTDAWGQLSHARIRAAGVPFEVMEARGWVHLPDGRTGMARKAAPDATGTDDDPEPEQPEAG